LSAQGGINIPSSIYSYLSTCSLSQTDCDEFRAVVGTGMIIVGVFFFSVGGFATATALISLEWHLVPLTAIAAVSGGLLVYGGVQIWIKSECLPVPRE